MELGATTTKNIISGNTYIISNVDSFDFTTVGAEFNTKDTIFTASEDATIQDTDGSSVIEKGNQILIKWQSSGN